MQAQSTGGAPDNASREKLTKGQVPSPEVQLRIPNVICKWRVAELLRVTGWVQEPSGTRKTRKIDPRLKSLRTSSGSNVTDKLIEHWLNGTSLADHYLRGFRELLEADKWCDPRSPEDGLHVIVLGLVDPSIQDWDQRVFRAQPRAAEARGRQVWRLAHKEALRAYDEAFEQARNKYVAEFKHVDQDDAESYAEYRESLESAEPHWRQWNVPPLPTLRGD